MVYYASYIIIGILIIVHSRESESAAENFQLKWTPQLLRKSRQLLPARLSRFDICSGRNRRAFGYFRRASGSVYTRPTPM